MTTPTQDQDLPLLPEPLITVEYPGRNVPVFDADMMRAYVLAALPQPASGEQWPPLDFKIEQRGVIWVLDWAARNGSGCRPATEEEVAMWHRLATPTAPKVEQAPQGEVARVQPLTERSYGLTLYEENWTASRRNCVVDRGESHFQTHVYASRADLVAAFVEALRGEWDERVVHINGYTYESLGKVKTAMPEPEPDEFWDIEQEAKRLIAESRATGAHHD
jgi:hypothetical protein